MNGNLASMILSNAQGRTVEVSFDWEGDRSAGWSAEGLGSSSAYFRQGFDRAARRPALVTSSHASRGRFFNPSRSFSYAYDAVGRPVSRSGDAFAYNARGEVTNAVLDDGVSRYAYDSIGNRTSACEDGKSTVYQSNAVNQYTNLTSNLSPLSSDLSYDLDGNLVDDGTRTFEWSAAGHLAAAETSTRRYECAYDYRGRRVKRTEYRRVGNNWSWVEDRDYVYDDWNLVYEHRDHTSEGETELSYFWGPDLSGTLQGAGGVGGLVAVSIDGDFYFPGYDNNGNVIGYWDESGSLVAEDRYDAFGNTIDEDGDMTAVFPHRFSTKYYDAESDLYYYGYRYYSPSLGRWISRDPIGEEGGYNLFVVCNNNPLAFIDPVGKQTVWNWIQVSGLESHSSGCAEWKQTELGYSGQGDRQSYVTHFKLSHFGNESVAFLNLSDDIKQKLADSLVSSIGIASADTKALWSMSFMSAKVGYTDLFFVIDPTCLSGKRCARQVVGGIFLRKLIRHDNDNDTKGKTVFDYQNNRDEKGRTLMRPAKSETITIRLGCSSN